MFKIKNFLIVLIFIIILFFGFNIFYKYTLNDVESLKIYDRNGILLYDVRQDYRQSNYTDISQVPQFIKDIVLYREDRRFYSHFGIDPVSIARAAYYNMVNMKFYQGGSTIDQQSVKLSKQNFSRSLQSKLIEQVLAFNINFHYSKDSILLYYINNLTFGNGVRGFNTACNIYFQKNCSNLSKSQIIYLFSLSKFPDRKDVSNYSYGFAQRYLSGNEYKLIDFKNIKESMGFYVSKKSPYYIDYVLNRNLKTQDGKLYTLFDFELYSKIQNILKSYEPYIHSKDAQDGCVIVMDKDTNIISMNVLKSYGHNQGGYINGCTVPRQVGSAIKPFLYSLAFENLGYNADTSIVDEPVSYFLDNGGKYEPKNFDMKYHGKVNLSLALGSSLNIPAVKIANEIGIDKFRDFLRKIGNEVGTDEKWNDDVGNYGLSIALGTKELSVVDFSKMWTLFIHDETSPNNFYKIYQKDFIKVKEILSQNKNRLISFPQYNWFDLPGTFAKSGTSRNFIDGWVCGGKTDKIVCVWIGNYTAKSMKDSGYNTAGVIWNNVIQIIK